MRKYISPKFETDTFDTINDVITVSTIDCKVGGEGINIDFDSWQIDY